MISIILPIYNAENYLDECLRSIENQDYKDFEVLCVNDGSNDNSPNICENYAKRDKRFILINQNNAGVSSARNRALSVARGKFVCFVDSDDVVSSDYLSTLLSFAEDGSFAVCGYTRDIKDLGANDEKYIKFSARDFVTSIFNESIEHPNICMMLFKNSIIQMQHLNFTLGCVRNEDTEFYVKYLMHEDNVTYSNKKCYFYRVNETSAMHVTTLKSLTGLEASKRIGEILVKNKFTNDANIDLYPTIQSLLYHLGREKNKNIYDYLHNHYEINIISKKLLSFPTFRRKFLSVVYLLLGPNLYYKMLSSRLFFFLPL